MSYLVSSRDSKSFCCRNDFYNLVLQVLNFTDPLTGLKSHHNRITHADVFYSVTSDGTTILAYLVLLRVTFTSWENIHPFEEYIKLTSLLSTI